MSHSKKQKGNSTLGLLSVLSVFVGLLAYANFYAFNNDSDTAEISQNKEGLSSTVKPSSILPLTRGIFDSDVLIAQDETESLDAVTQIAPTETTVIANNQPAQSDSTLIQEQTVASVEDDFQHTMIPVPQVAVQKTLFDRDEMAFGIDAANMTRSANQGFYQGNSLYRGNGRGQVRANGDGEFDFSMTFKSRGRMQADSDFDANANSHFNTLNKAYYLGDSGVHPAYSAYYQGY